MATKEEEKKKRAARVAAQQKGDRTQHPGRPSTRRDPTKTPKSQTPKKPTPKKPRAHPGEGSADPLPSSPYPSVRRNVKKHPKEDFADLVDTDPLKGTGRTAALAAKTPTGLNARLRREGKTPKPLYGRKVPEPKYTDGDVSSIEDIGKHQRRGRKTAPPKRPDALPASQPANTGAFVTPVREIRGRSTYRPSDLAGNKPEPRGKKKTNPLGNPQSKRQRPPTPGVGVTLKDLRPSHAPTQYKGEPGKRISSKDYAKGLSDKEYRRTIKPRARRDVRKIEEAGGAVRNKKIIPTFSDPNTEEWYRQNTGVTGKGYAFQSQTAAEKKRIQGKIDERTAARKKSTAQREARTGRLQLRADALKIARANKRTTPNASDRAQAKADATREKAAVQATATGETPTGKTPTRKTPPMGQTPGKTPPKGRTLTDKEKARLKTEVTASDNRRRTAATVTRLATDPILGKGVEAVSRKGSRPGTEPVQKKTTGGGQKKTTGKAKPKPTPVRPVSNKVYDKDASKAAGKKVFRDATEAEMVPRNKKHAADTKDYNKRMKVWEKTNTTTLDVTAEPTKGSAIGGKEGQIRVYNKETGVHEWVDDPKAKGGKPKTGGVGTKAKPTTAPDLPGGVDTPDTAGKPKSAIDRIRERAGAESAEPPKGKGKGKGMISQEAMQKVNAADEELKAATKAAKDSDTPANRKRATDAQTSVDNAKAEAEASRPQEPEKKTKRKQAGGEDVVDPEKPKGGDQKQETKGKGKEKPKGGGQKKGVGKPEVTAAPTLDTANKQVKSAKNALKKATDAGKSGPEIKRLADAVTAAEDVVTGLKGATKGGVGKVLSTLGKFGKFAGRAGTLAAKGAGTVGSLIASPFAAGLGTPDLRHRAAALEGTPTDQGAVGNIAADLMAVPRDIESMPYDQLVKQAAAAEGVRPEDLSFKDKYIDIPLTGKRSPGVMGGIEGAMRLGGSAIKQLGTGPLQWGRQLKSALHGGEETGLSTKVNNPYEDMINTIGTEGLGATWRFGPRGPVFDQAGFKNPEEYIESLSPERKKALQELLAVRARQTAAGVGGERGPAPESQALAAQLAGQQTGGVGQGPGAGTAPAPAPDTTSVADDVISGKTAPEDAPAATVDNAARKVEEMLTSMPQRIQEAETTAKQEGYAALGIRRKVNPDGSPGVLQGVTAKGQKLLQIQANPNMVAPKVRRTAMRQLDQVEQQGMRAGQQVRQSTEQMVEAAQTAQELEARIQAAKGRIPKEYPPKARALRSQMEDALTKMGDLAKSDTGSASQEYKDAQAEYEGYRVRFEEEMGLSEKTPPAA